MTLTFTPSVESEFGATGADGAAIKINDGGDIKLVATTANPSRIIFNDGTNDRLYLQGYYDNTIHTTNFAIVPPTNQTSSAGISIYIGYPSYTPWHIGIYAHDKVILNAVHEINIVSGGLVSIESGTTITLAATTKLYLGATGATQIGFCGATPRTITKAWKSDGTTLASVISAYDTLVDDLRLMGLFTS